MGRFDLVQPSLIQQLRSILEQYQDDGQILKELIQNAEDARATDVKFLLDETEFDRKGKNLHHPDLAQYQGAALYSYNNAQFTERDWVGLKMINDSVKKGESLKVGRFGLGFKSVFHMTDLPSVISADKVSFIDPHEKYFTEDNKKVTGFTWHLKDDYKSMKKIPSQFDVYKGLFGVSDATFKNGHYDGTLFRFPLRRQTSQVSNNLYSSSKVLEIFETYQSIAELSILFLTHVESIEIYHRPPGQMMPQLLFKVCVSPESLMSVRSQRHHFLSRFNGSSECQSDNRVVYPISINCHTVNGYKSSKRSITYMTSHFCLGRNSISEELLALAGDRDSQHNLTPWTGAAVRIDETESKDLISGGHVFCFLPLPLQQTSMTGLPVHINGFFSVSSNRHQLKWPSISAAGQRDSVGTTGVTDRGCLWNQLLIEEVVPRCYFGLISGCIELAKRNPQQFSPNFIYSLIPDSTKVNENWKPVLSYLFRLLSHIEFIQSASNDQWLNYQKVIMLTLSKQDENVHQVLLSALKLSGVNAALVPDHIADVLQNNMSAGEMFATPELMRLVLKKKPRILTRLSSDEKTTLLAFLLRDGNYQQMNGLPLLPLSNGEFTMFSTDSLQPHIYIPNDSHPSSVLPMLTDRFTDISNRIDETTLKALNQAAQKKVLQLRIFTHSIFTELLPTVLNDQSLLDSSFLAQVIWEYILQNNTELTLFEHLPLLLTTNNQNHQIFTLDSAQPVIYLKGDTGSSLTDKHVISSLQLLSIRFTETIPRYLLTSNIIMNKYIYPPTSHGFLSILRVYYSKNNTESSFRKLSTEQILAVRHILSKLIKSQIVADDVTFLSKLPIFVQIGSSDKFISAEKCTASASHDCPLLPPTCHLLDCSESSSKALLELLSIQELSPLQVIIEHIIPELKRGDLEGYDIDRVCSHILNNMNALSDKEQEKIITEFSVIKFLLREDGERCVVSQCFDPSDKLLSQLLYQDGLFPVESYRGAAVLDSLCKLGLKQSSDIDSKQLIHTVKRIEELSLLTTSNKKSLINKSLSLLRVLDTRLELLNHDNLVQMLKTTCWVTPLKQAPPNYPHSLTWFNPGMVVVLPDSITSEEHVNKVSSVMSILPVTCSDKLRQVLGWYKQPEVTFVIEHLSNIIQSYRAVEKGLYMSMLSDVYHYLQNIEYEERNDALQQVQLSSWIWYGDGFISPDRVLIERPQISLTPYVYSLPAEMSEFIDMFTQHHVWTECNINVYLEVLTLMRDKYQQIELFDNDEIKLDVKLALDIIDYMKPDEGDTLDPEIRDRLLVPTADCSTSLHLVPVSDVTYCDEGWLAERRGQLEGHEHVQFIHPGISNEVAERIGIPSLVNRMLDTDTFELGEGFGQSESLTRRLHNLLQEYSDGFSVPKELIQNADDAGATEVRFLIDFRKNQDALNCLIDDGMKECQGPALWVYNNAVFTDSDFEAIIKLSGATKSHQTEKIGGFGLGFNAVYNLTDVPSFVSRNFIVIFDPHTTHLGKSIPDASKPGIKIDLAKNKKALSTLKNQFKPYLGVFGCDLQPRGHSVNYDGTLFRFPLRSAEQAVQSEISNLHYDRNQVLTLMTMLCHSCENLLLFTQNVRKVSVYHINEFENPKQAKLLFSCNKEPIKYIRELHVPINLPATVKNLTEDEQEFTRQSSILKAASTVLQDMKNARNSRSSMSARVNRLSLSSRQSLPASSLLIKMRFKLAITGCQILRIPNPKDESTPWLVTSTLGDGEALDQACKLDGLTPVGGVAVKLKCDGISGESYSPVVLRDSQTDSYSGNVFCYLPLPITSKLPVHINGAFAVSTNRRTLIEKITDNKTNDLYEWNKILLSDSIKQAYYLMLEDIRSICDGTSAPFYLLWPRISDVIPSCSSVVNSFYSGLCQPTNELQLFSRNGIWSRLSSTLLLEPALRDSHIYKQTLAVLDRVMSNSNSTHLVLDIPDEIRAGFIKAGCESSIDERTITRNQLYERIIFPNISKFDSSLRDTLVLYALDCNDKTLNELLRSHECIPVTPDGTRLRFIQDLIHPSSSVSVMYTPDDARFPCGSTHTFLSTQRLALLESLGMLADLPDTEVLERLNSVAEYYTRDRTAAMSRLSALLLYMDRKLNNYPDLYNDIKSAVLSTPLLPAVKGSEDLPFYSDTLHSGLLPPTDIYQWELLSLVCLIKPVLDQKKLSMSVSQRLQNYLMLNKQPTLEDVMSQLDALRTWGIANSKRSYQLVKSICESIYQFIQEKADGSVIESLDRFILINDRLVSADLIAKSGARDCQPYLYELPYDLHRFEHLFRRAGMKDKFEYQDYVRALIRMYEKFKDTPLDSRSLEISLNLSSQLHSLMTSRPEVTNSELGVIYLPDTNHVLREANTLCFNDCLWLPDQNDMSFAHTLIPYQVAKGLGVNTKRQEAIKSHSHGIPFGQKEKLTKRLRRIMSSYPCGREILKELVQNADDAGATQIHIVSDMRTHPTEKVFEECWKPLQGPAVCVYNNRPFSKSDLEGIQNLGEGSKGADPNRTGQYGVGFNSVYHLTDSPSFLTSGPEVGEVLCAFDPHCKFVPGATPSEPGRMFDEVSGLRSVFSDVFKTYLPEHFSTDNGTMFRFPLRNKEMAAESKISNTPVTTETVNDLIGRFKAEMFDVLLFVNNLEEVSISEIPRIVRGTPQLQSTYTVKAKVTQRYGKMRRDFNTYVKQVATQLKSGELTLDKIETRQVSYKVTIEDSTGLKETWLVVQRIGFEDPHRIPYTVLHAFSTGELALLPRGGVASLLNRQLPVDKSGKQIPVTQRPSKVFCFLPLPIQTKLPVHINGHFALDHEARRALWRDEDGGPRTDWNETLISRVICPAYRKLIEACKDKSFPSLDGVTAHLPLTQAKELLNTYHSLFPQTQSDDNWTSLVNSLYTSIGVSSARLFPVLNQKSSKSGKWEESEASSAPVTDESDSEELTNHNTAIQISANQNKQHITHASIILKSTNQNGVDKMNGSAIMEHHDSVAEIAWYPLLGQSDDMAFFCDQTASNVPDDVITALISGGLNILHTPYSIYQSFTDAGIQCYMMSAAVVVEFLKSNRLLMPDLPAPINTTPFYSREILLQVIKYCKDLPTLVYSLDDLPFGIAEDDRLHYLSEDERLFYSEDNSLVPECSDLFLHSQLVSSAYLDVPQQIDQVRVFKPFGVEEFGLYINQALEQTFCPSSNIHMIKWEPESQAKPNRSWLCQVWSFLSNKCQPLVDEYEEEPRELLEQLEVTLFALHSWCLLPVYASPDILLTANEIRDHDLIIDEEQKNGKEGSALREISLKLSHSRNRLTSSTNSLNNSIYSTLPEDKEHYLISLQHAHTVLDFNVKDGMSDPMKQALRKLKIPELNYKLIDGKSSQFGRSPGKPAATGSAHSASAFARFLCARINDPNSILDCLIYCVERAKRQQNNIGQLLHATECNLILKYFSESIFNNTLRLDEKTRSDLRQLPFYVALSGQHTDLGECRVFILPTGIPSTEIDVWRSRAGVLFLQRNDSLENLFDFLECQSLTDIQVYCQFIFKHFEYLSDEGRIVHLTYIRDRKLPLLTEEERRELLSELSILRFIKDSPPERAVLEEETAAESENEEEQKKLDDDIDKKLTESTEELGTSGSTHSDQSDQSDSCRLYTANRYYDTENRLFQLMLSRSNFPPAPFDNYRWIRFLKLIGLNTDVSHEMFVKFAQEIAEKRTSIPPVECEERAKALVQTLYKTMNLASEEDLLHQLSVIPFICAAEANSKYHEFCTQYGFSDGDAVFVSYKNSLCATKDNIKCAWTSAHFLPHWADPNQLKSSEVQFDYHDNDPLSSLDEYKTEIASQLGILSHATTAQIVAHVRNISETVLLSYKQPRDRKIQETNSKLLIDTMSRVYKHMHDHCMEDNEASDRLYDIPCVLIEEGKTMVTANQLVVNLYEEQQIKPFLYKTPSELSDYNSLFKYLGATERATSEQFAAVLDKLYEQHQGEKLDPNSLRCAYRSVKGLFSLLSKNDQICDITSLYLPSQDARLTPACDLVYNDELNHSERLTEFRLPFLVDLRECKLQISYFSDITSKLPAELRPMLLTEVVEECLSESCQQKTAQIGAAAVLKARLTSSEFTSGILRLIRHDHLERGEKPKQSALKTVHKSLKNIQVISVDQLETYLKYDGEIIPNSQNEADCFVTKDSSNSWCLYVKTETEVCSELLVKVAEIVNRVAGGLLQNSIIYVHPILTCGTYEIPLTLDRLKIRQDHQTAKSKTLQPPGSFIPLDLHHLLKQDFVEFQADEYVGYELDDPMMSQQMGDATYIYAIILEKLPVECAMYDRGTQQFFDRYRINIGEDEHPIIVSTLDLYRLHRVIEKPRPKTRHASTSSEIFVDVLTTNESGDYLLMSPSMREDTGIPEQHEDEDEETDEDKTPEPEDITPDQPESGETTTEEHEQIIEEVWEETVHITPPPDEKQSMNDETDSKPPPQSQSTPQKEQKTNKKVANQKSAEANTEANKQAAAEASKVEYPEINEKNVEQIKKLLNQQVRAVWKLPEEQRKKIIKRLMLKFHPDKNPDRSDLCTQLTQCIRSIIEDIEDGGFVADSANRGDWWSEFINRRAKAYGEQKDDFETKLKETYAKYASTLGEEFAADSGSRFNSSSSKAKFEEFKTIKRNPVPAEARRWMSQARADLKSAYNDMNEEEPAYEWAQLKLYQSAEKSLKCACYTIDSKKINLSDLKLISSSLRDSHVTSIAKSIGDLIGPPDHVTYPGSTGFPKTPHELREKGITDQVAGLVEQLHSHIDEHFLQVMEDELNPKPTNFSSSKALVLVKKPKNNIENSVETES